MKKLLPVCLVLLMLALPALAEPQVFCAGNPGEAPYEMAQRLAEQMEGELVAAPTALEAINQFLAADGEEAVYVGDPMGMILSLQGYTDQDLRTAITPAARLASAPATVYAAPAVVSQCPDTTEQGLLAYTEYAPFELFIARLIDASPEDYLTLEATALFYMDQNLYMDYAEMAQAAQEGALDVCVFGAFVPEEVKNVMTPLYMTELEGPFLGVFVQKNAAILQQAESAALALAGQEETQALLQQLGYGPDTFLDAAAFADQVQALFQRYIQYLTNEGLFFYEF